MLKSYSPAFNLNAPEAAAAMPAAFSRNIRSFEPPMPMTEALQIPEVSVNPGVQHTEHC